MNKYILINELFDGTQTVEGFFPTVKKAVKYAKLEKLENIYIYELVDDNYNLAE